jgi:hypothetical protein
MTIVLPKNATKKQVREAMDKVEKAMLKKKGRKGNIVRHFGSCKSRVDGLEFQKKVRSEWD